MPRSGATVPKELETKYKEFKMGKKSKWQMYRVDVDAMKWEFLKDGQNIEELSNEAPGDDCACIFAEVEDAMKDGTTKTKITCIQWWV